MRRRDFCRLVGGAAAWPVAARAQQSAMPVVGWLRAGGPPEADQLAAFRQGLNELGYVEGRNVAVEFRNSEQGDVLLADASELVRRQVAAIFANNLPAAVAARAATATIPIVFQIGGDPIRDGLVTNLSRPTGNLTGVTRFGGELLPKRLELLRELVPTANLFAVLLNANNPNSETRAQDVREAARSAGQQILVLDAGSESNVDMAFGTIVQQGAAALLVVDDPFFYTHHEQIVALAARHRIPTSYFSAKFVEAGGLMSYGGNSADQTRAAGRYVGRILKGDKPADLPVLQPTTFVFMINLKTAKALGIEFPPSFHLPATGVIE